MPTAERYRLIPAAPVDANKIAVRFEALATLIQARDQCTRVEALQRAIDEHPGAYAQYLAAFRRADADA